MTPITVPFMFEIGQDVLRNGHRYVIRRRRYLDYDTGAAIEYLAVPHNWHYAELGGIGDLWVTAEALQPMPSAHSAPVS